MNRGLRAAAANRLLECVIALILIAGAAGKFYYLAFGRTINLSAAVFGVRFLVALAVIELIVGLMLAFGPTDKNLIRWTGLLFSGFAAYSLFLVAVGRSSCECLGEVPLHPAVMLGVDIAVIGACVAWLKLIDLRSVPVIPNSNAAARIIAPMFAMSLLALLFATHTTEFGRRILARINGEKCVIVRSNSIENSATPEGWRRMAVSVQNVSDTPISVRGLLRSCACREACHLPVEISPESTSKVNIDVRIPKRSGVFVVPVQLYVSSVDQPLTAIVTPLVGWR